MVDTTSSDVRSVNFSNFNSVGTIFSAGFYRECRAHSKISKSAARTAAAENRSVSGQQVEQLKLLGDFNLKRRVLVRRMHLPTIVAARLVTVPVAALLAAASLLGLVFVMAG